LKQLSKHLTFANAISCIALFMALSGAAYAATTTLANKAVKTKNLANGSVTTLKLRGGAVTTLKLKNGAVTGPKIGPGAVGSTALAGGSVRSSQLGGGVVTEGKLKNGAVTEAKLATNAVTNSKLGPEAVAAGKLGKEAVTSDKLSASLLAQLARNVSYVTKVSLSNNTEESKSVAADCPTGKQVLGGGARIVGSTTTVAIAESAPVVSAEKRTGWSAAARAIAPEGSAWAVEATAICAEL
jgi:trimeric autotransporter adhesin